MEVNSSIESRGIVMVAVLFVMLFLGILLTIAFLRLDGELEGTVGQSKSTKCLFVAEAGIEKTISRLRTNPFWRGGFTEEALEDMNGNIIGYYTVVFVSETPEIPWTRIFVTSTGMLNLNDTEYRRTIQAEVLTANPAEFFAFTTDKAKITNMADIQNGNLYARQLEFSICLAYPDDLNISEKTFYLKGYNTIIDDPNGTTPPNVNLHVAPTEIANPVAFPSLDVDYYKQLAKNGGRYYSSNATFDGISLDSAENGVIFAEGDIYIQGEIEDPVVVVANKNIYITGNITWAENNGVPVGKLGLFAKEDIYIAGNAPPSISVRAQLIADGGIFEALNDPTSPNQGPGSKNDLHFKGSMAIRGGKSKEYGAVDLSVYGDRTYSYDSSLLSSPELPYITYIAHLASWKEI